MNLKKLLASLKNPGAELVSLRSVRERGLVCRTRDGRLTGVSRKETCGLMVEALYKGNFAWAACVDTSQRAAQEALDRAFALAAGSQGQGVFPFTKEVRPASQGSWKSAGGSSLPGAQECGALCDSLISACGTMRVSDKIATTSATFALRDRTHHLVSDAGADLEQHFTFVGRNFSAVARDGGIVQTRSASDLFQGDVRDLNDSALPERLTRVGEEALELLHAEECPDETLDLLLLPEQMLLQIHESIGHPLEIDRILGDERNYAGSSFVTLEDFGRLEYGSPLLNIVFEPQVSGQFASYAFDDNGAPATERYLIKDGVLLRGLGGLESQARSSTPGVACARASSWNRPPIDRMANVNMRAGKDSLEEMIASVERGVLMDTNRSFSIDDFRRKFQFGCEYAKLIENGKLTRTLRNPNYHGETLPFWRGLKKVGRTREVLGLPYCGKGEPNQAMRVGHASPPCLFEKVRVFGGEGT